MGQTPLETKSLYFNIENDVIHYSVPVVTFSPRFRVQSMPLIELSPLAETGFKSAHHAWSNATRNHIPILLHGKMTSSTIRFQSRLFHPDFESKVCRYTLTWENDVIHYSLLVATFSPRFRVQ